MGIRVILKTYLTIPSVGYFNVTNESFAQNEFNRLTTVRE